MTSIAAEVATVIQGLERQIAAAESRAATAEERAALIESASDLPTDAAERIVFHAAELSDALQALADELPDSLIAPKLEAWRILVSYPANEAKRIIGTRR